MYIGVQIYRLSLIKGLTIISSTSSTIHTLYKLDHHSALVFIRPAAFSLAMSLFLFGAFICGRILYVHTIVMLQIRHDM